MIVILIIILVTVAVAAGIAWDLINQQKVAKGFYLLFSTTALAALCAALVIQLHDEKAVKERQKYPEKYRMIIDTTYEKL